MTFLRNPIFKLGRDVAVEQGMLLCRNLPKKDLMEESRKIFFPNDMSSRYGNADDFEFDIMDYQGISLNDDITIKEVSDITKLPNLRFYLGMKMMSTDITTHSSPAGTSSMELVTCEENGSTSPNINNIYMDANDGRCSVVNITESRAVKPFAVDMIASTAAIATARQEITTNVITPDVSDDDT